MNTQNTQTERMIIKSNIESFVRVRKSNSYNGYIGANLIKGFGRTNEKAITNIIVDENGEYATIYTDSYRRKVKASSVTKMITIKYYVTC